MSAAGDLRQRATRLLARATIAHGEGHADLAESLTALAMRYLDRAGELEAAEGKSPEPTRIAEQRPAQQQQQIQPKKDDDESAC